MVANALICCRCWAGKQCRMDSGTWQWAFLLKSSHSCGPIQNKLFWPIGVCPHPEMASQSVKSIYTMHSMQSIRLKNMTNIYVWQNSQPCSNSFHTVQRQLLFYGQIGCKVVFELPDLWVGTRTTIDNNAASTRDVRTVQALFAHMHNRSVCLNRTADKLTLFK